MIGAHAFGIMNDHRILGATTASCFVCQKTSECQIVQYQRYAHVFFFRTKASEEQYWFNWWSCMHRAILYEPAHVARYRLEQVETGLLALPSYQDMSLKMMDLPKRMPLALLILVLVAALLLSFLLGALIVYINDKLGIPFIP
jgi:hypothetical protein